MEKKAPVDPDASLDLKDPKVLLQFDFDFELFQDDMEITKDNVLLLDIIGEGAFGLVRKALLLPTGREVAVKTLKDGPSVDDIKGFFREIEVMKSVHKHPNIVCIVGHYTKNIFDVMLLTEYCSEGNLLEFLRNIWQQLAKPHSKYKQLTPHQKTPECLFNFDTSITEKESITYKQIHNSGNELSATKYLQIVQTNRMNDDEVIIMGYFFFCSIKIICFYCIFSQ